MITHPIYLVRMIQLVPGTSIYLSVFICVSLPLSVCGCVLLCVIRRNDTELAKGSGRQHQARA